MKHNVSVWVMMCQDPKNDSAMCMEMAWEFKPDVPPESEWAVLKTTGLGEERTLAELCRRIKLGDKLIVHNCMGHFEAFVMEGIFLKKIISVSRNGRFGPVFGRMRTPGGPALCSTPSEARMGVTISPRGE